MIKISNRSAIRQLGFFIAAIAMLLSPLANAEVGKWMRLGNGHTVQDYYRPVNNAFIDLVNFYHMRPKEQLPHKSVLVYHADDIEYTLTHIPNHPLALQRATETCTQHPDLYSCLKVEKRFKEAIDWDPQQPNTRILYGIFLQLQDNEKVALEQYMLALKLKPGMADAHYNIALIFYKQENWEKAAEHAKAAYANGHRAPGLRRKLREKGYM